LCLAALAVVGVAYAAAYAVQRALRRPNAADRAALVTLAGVGLFYGYPALRWLDARVGGAPRVLAVGAIVTVLVATAFGVRALRRYAPPSGAVGSRVSVAGALLVAWTLARMGYAHAHDARVIAHSALVRELARPVPRRGAASRARPRRDVYVIILDEYASAEVLRERFGFDNRPFEDTLLAMGFRIPASVRSNYAVTTLSLPSLLNFAHMRPLADDMAAASRDWTPAAYVLEHNRAARFLKSQGYRYLFFPARYFAPTQQSADADEQYDPYTGVDIARGVYGSELAFTLVANTPLTRLRPLFRSYTAVRFEHARRTLDGLGSVPARPGPKFVVAHVLMPHLPFTVDAACRPLPAPSWNVADFSGHLRCVNSLTLRTLRELITRSAIPPIIILQGDHGTQSLHPFDNTPGVLTTAQARERFRALGAYYLPDGGAAAMPDSVSIVNVFRYVLDYYFDADLPPLPDTMYFSNWVYPYAMTRVGDDFRPAGPRRTASRALGR
jgi:hypothetical protein